MDGADHVSSVLMSIGRLGMLDLGSTTSVEWTVKILMPWMEPGSR
jgi:hypothetical protein